ncbi:MAG TPA: type II secretion system protein [bacterium]|nr:type II secretion system protein [bacterium]
MLNCAVHRRSPLTGCPPRGFTLLEILLVVAIIAILMAMAIPQVTGAKRSAYEVSAMKAIETLGAAQMAYHASYRQFTTFDELQRKNYVDPGYKHGGPGGDAERIAKHYSVFIVMEPQVRGRYQGFSIFGIPEPGFGLKTFRMTENGIMQESTGGGFSVK